MSSLRDLLRFFWATRHFRAGLSYSAATRLGLEILTRLPFCASSPQSETPTRSDFALASIMSRTCLLAGASLSRVVGNGPFTVK
jgi:hypothetical protein